jgi:hypothetical protein
VGEVEAVAAAFEAVAIVVEAMAAIVSTALTAATSTIVNRSTRECQLSRLSISRHQ